MLTIIVAKVLLKGAIKTFIVKPALASTVTLVPNQSILHATLFGHQAILSTADLIKFGAEKLYEKFGEKNLDFQVEKIGKHIYGISPAEEFAALFAKEYANDQQIIVDLSKFEEYLDELVAEYMDDLNKVDALGEKLFEQDEVLLQTLHDIDLSIERSKPHTFETPEDEARLIDEVLQKNMKLMEKNLKEKRRVKRQPQSAVDEILADFPSAPYTPKSDEEEIDAILAKFKPKSKKEIKHKIHLEI